MPDPTPPSLESLASAAVREWEKWQEGGGDLADLSDTLNAIHAYLAVRQPNAGHYLTPGERVQVEVRLACAMLAHWPAYTDDFQAIVDKARHLARLLLDGPDEEEK